MAALRNGPVAPVPAMRVSDMPGVDDVAELAMAGVTAWSMTAADVDEPGKRHADDSKKANR